MWQARGPRARDGTSRLMPRATRENPSPSPIELLARPPSSSTIIAMSHSGRMSYQNGKSRLCSPLYSQRSTRLRRVICDSIVLFDGSM